MTQTIYRKVTAGILRIELRVSSCGTPFTRETLLRLGTRQYRAALALI